MRSHVHVHSLDGISTLQHVHLISAQAPCFSEFEPHRFPRTCALWAMEVPLIPAPKGRFVLLLLIVLWHVVRVSLGPWRYAIEAGLCDEYVKACAPEAFSRACREFLFTSTRAC